jgi:hypothetical protein
LAPFVFVLFSLWVSVLMSLAEVTKTLYYNIPYVTVSVSTNTSGRFHLHLKLNVHTLFLLYRTDLDGERRRRRRRMKGRSGGQGDMPDWIRELFALARRGNLEKLVSTGRQGYTDMYPAWAQDSAGNDASCEVT